MSKIYKGNDSCELKKVLFLDFDRNLEEEDFVAAADQPKERSQKEHQNGNEPCFQDPASVNLEKIKEEAFIRGKQAGLELAETQFGETVNALAATCEDIRRLRETILKNSTQDMLRLVMAIAGQVIQCEVADKKDVILATLNRALKAAVKSDEFHVKVNPEDFSVVTEKKPLFLASISGLKNITFEADPQIARGGCLVESTLGQVDATIETQMGEIRQHLLHSMESG